MKATLEFNLIDADERMAHLRCVKAMDMAIVLWELKMNILNPKYELDADEIRDRFDELLNSQNINIEELIN